MNQGRRTPERDSCDSLQENASIDGLIRWLDGKRAAHPTQPLADFIDQDAFSAESLVELAAVDLIGQRRRGRDVLPEDYLKQFPRLSDSDAHVLDLIDAELCVRREMNDSRDASFFITRFPKLADDIGQLVHLEFRQGTASDLSESIAAELSLHDDRGTEPSSDPGTIDFHAGDPSASDHFIVQRDLTIAGSQRRVAANVGDTGRDDLIDVPISDQASKLDGRVAVCRHFTDRKWPLLACSRT